MKIGQAVEMFVLEEELTSLVGLLDLANDSEPCHALATTGREIVGDGFVEDAGVSLIIRRRLRDERFLIIPWRISSGSERSRRPQLLGDRLDRNDRIGRLGRRRRLRRVLGQARGRHRRRQQYQGGQGRITGARDTGISHVIISRMTRPPLTLKPAARLPSGHRSRRRSRCWIEFSAVALPAARTIGPPEAVFAS